MPTLHCLTTDMRNNIFAGRDFVEHQSGWYWSVSKMLIIMEPRDIFGSNFADLFISPLSSNWYAK